MFGRLASRVLTGPLAFLVAGTLDLLGYWLGAARRAVRPFTLAGRARLRRIGSGSASSTITRR